MGSVYSRGTRSKPNWYVSYKDADGKRRAVASHQPTKALARRHLERIEARIANGQVGVMEPKTEPVCGPLLEEWSNGIRNRTADKDRGVVRNHLLPAFEGMRLSTIDLATVMRWIDKQRTTTLADASIRKQLGVLSRFFSWAIERGITESNPVRLIPAGKRPSRSAVKRDGPWLQDERLVMQLIHAMPEPVNYLFYLGNRSGMRTGELISLRLSDFGFLDEGVIRVRYSHDGPLKEDKRNEGKVKWVPSADDCASFLGPWLEKRRAETDDMERHVFPAILNPLERYNTKTLEDQWDTARKCVGVELTWYQATRHSFASRLSAAGVPIGEIADALGHSSPAITRLYYDHYIRRSYSGRLRGGLGLNNGQAQASQPAAAATKPLRVIGVLGGIRAEDEHLAVALAHLRSAGVDRILSVGDVVDGPGDVAHTCAQLAAADIDVVRGNHDRWLLDDTMRELPDATALASLAAAERQFLGSLPVVREYATDAGRLLLCHGLGVHDMAGIEADDDVADHPLLQALVASDCYRIVISGHSRTRMVRKFGSLALVSPGALAGGFARIDLAAGEVAYFDLVERDGELVVEDAGRHAFSYPD